MKIALQISIFLALFVGVVHAASPAFSTILGGVGQEYATSVVSDAQGNVFVVGLTYSPDFPVTAGAVQTKFGGTCDAFITKLGPDGKVRWSTYLGGILDDWATGVALDGAGNVLVAGYTRSQNFPLANALMGTLNNGASPSDYDAFVAKLSQDGAKLLYSTAARPRLLCCSNASTTFQEMDADRLVAWLFRLPLCSGSRTEKSLSGSTRL